MRPVEVNMTLYQTPGSRSDRALWAIRELGLCDKLTLKKIDILRADNHTDEYKEKNIMRQVPTLVFADPTNGTKHTMTESAAIALFLAENSGSSLQPAVSNSLARAQYYRIASLAATSVDTIVYTVFFNEVIAPESMRNPNAAAKARTDFAEKPLKAIEAIFSNKDSDVPVEYICEPYHKGFTIADVILGQILLVADKLGLLDNSPLVKAYADRLRERPMYKNLHSE